MNELSPRQVEELKSTMPPAWYGTRRGRRTAAGMGVAALALVWAIPFTSWALGPGSTASWTTLGLIAAALLIYCGVLAVLVAATDGAVTRDERKLDERQLAERRRIDAVAHRVSALMLGTAALLVAAFGATDHVLTVPTLAAFMYVGAAWASHKVIPHIVACWLLPDAPGDE